MNCYTHPRAAAVGVCAVCQKAVCRDCVLADSPRLVCRPCAERGVIGYEYRSAAAIGSLPLIHIVSGVNPVTMRPKIARGVIAIGNVAVGGVAIGGAAFGLLSLGGLSIGVLFALGGAALGIGLSIGGLAIGSVAVGGGAIGFSYAIGGGAIAPAAIDGLRCDEAAREFVTRWVGPAMLPPACR